LVREGLILSWEARAIADRPDAPRVPDGSGAGNEGWLSPAARFAPDPARVELNGKAALVAMEPLKPKRISIEAVFRVKRAGGPLQLVVTTHRPKTRRITGGKGNTRQWILEIRGDPPQGLEKIGHLEFGIFGQDMRWHLVQSDARLTRGWHHALGSFDGKTVRLFLDGKLQKGRATYEGEINQPPDGIVNVPAVGSNNTRGSHGFQGAAALARIYSRALTDGEVARNYAYAKTLVPALTLPPAQRTRPKPKFRVLYSNDFTNLNIISPYHKKREPFHPDHLRASVAETAGTHVHLLQPAHGWVPWWPSKLYPMDEHVRWWAKHYGLEPSQVPTPSVHRYIREGGDPFKVFVEECNRVGQAPFISLRLNDTHHLAHADTPKNRRGSHAISRFYVEHPQYRIDGLGTAHCWSVPEARAHKLAFIREICETYDISGFELDFMRFPRFFRDTVPLHKRERIITQFVTDVRELLDRTAKPGQYRWLCARVPCKLDLLADVGLDLVELVDAGVDMLNLSPSYFTVQTHDAARMKQVAPDAAVYVEMCHCTLQGKSTGLGGDNRIFTRTTDEQYYTTAHLAYRRGADGVSLFNFVYTREHGTPGRGPFNEPPFHVLARLADPDWLAKQPQWYVLSNTWLTPLDGWFERGDAKTYKLDMAPTENQSRDGVLRIMTKRSCAGKQWMAKMNGATLKPIPYVHKPLDHPYEAGLGDPNQYACFECPRSEIRDGINRIAIILERGARADIQYLDVVLP